jgi:branched-chain amino acid transport system ATP-binding protein
MESIVGSSISVFVGLTVVLFGGVAWMTGRALSRAWKRAWVIAPYGLLLGLGARFLTYALFEGELLSLTGYLASTAVIWLFMLFAYRIYMVRQMLRQYPWMYERHRLLTWREKAPVTKT